MLDKTCAAIRLQSIDTEFVEEFNRCLSKVLNMQRHALGAGPVGRRRISKHVISYCIGSYRNRSRNGGLSLNIALNAPLAFLGVL